jgi:hypothetical protein
MGIASFRSTMTPRQIPAAAMVIAVAPWLFLMMSLGGCARKVPDEVKPVLETQRAAAVKVAEEAAKVCSAAKGGAPFQPSPIDAPPPPSNPAKGTSLEAEPRVTEVNVMCSWRDPRGPAEVWAGTSLPPLRGPSTPLIRAVTMPEDFAENSCDRDRHNCEQVIVPSRYSKAERSADLRVVRPTAEGGEAEVIVVIAIP